MDNLSLINELKSRGYTSEGYNILVNRQKKYRIYASGVNTIIETDVNLNAEEVNELKIRLEAIKSKFMVNRFDVDENSVKAEINYLSDDFASEETRINYLIDDLDKIIVNKVNIVPNTANTETYTAPYRMGQQSILTSDAGVYGNFQERNSMMTHTTKIAETGYSPLGVIGALIGAILGAIAIMLVARIGFFASALGVLTGFLIIYFYKLFSKKMIPLPLLVFSILFSVMLSSLLIIAVQYMKYYDFMTSMLFAFNLHFRPGYIRTLTANYNAFEVWKNFLMILIFTVLGASSYFRRNRGINHTRE